MKKQMSDAQPGAWSAAEALFADAVSRAAVGMAIVSADGIVRVANPVFGRVTGVPAALLAGRALDELVELDSPPELPAALAGPGFVSMVVGIRRADGQNVPATLDLAPLSSAFSRGALLARLRERGSRLPDESGPDAALAPDEVVALIRQQTREPLTSIRGYAELIADLVRDPVEMAGLARIIHDEALHLAWLLEDLALLERIASGELTLRLDDIDLNSVIRDAARRLRAPAGGVEIVLDLDPALPPIAADRDLLLQMVTGLVRGMLRSSAPVGEVRIRTMISRRRARLSVTGGIFGVELDDLNRGFELHQRTDDTRGPAVPGSGLGLPIARGIARLHGGRAWAESSPGEGVTIHLSLPVGGP
ncbi:MAG: PAS domain-containing sensor histidine kinase [Thermomicrobiales bacterium]